MKTDYSHIPVSYASYSDAVQGVTHGERWMRARWVNKWLERLEPDYRKFMDPEMMTKDGFIQELEITPLIYGRGGKQRVHNLLMQFTVDGDPHVVSQIQRPKLIQMLHDTIVLATRFSDHRIYHPEDADFTADDWVRVPGSRR